MACVYRGALEGTGGFERQVAVKVLHPHLADDDEYVAMFHKEAQIASRLAHPVLVPVTDLGNAEGIHYMVMDFLEGETLSELNARYSEMSRPFPRGHAIWIVAQVLDGLHYAHELVDDDGEAMGVVHRDVSPKNILISQNGAVRLVDFGVARQANKGQTRAGVVKGTIPYMAPEQARGEHPDRRADIFAAAMLLHELLTGAPPVDDEQTEIQRQSLAKGIVKIDLKKIHLKMRSVMQKALAVKPENRFDTAADFAYELRELLPILEPDYEPAKLIGITGMRKLRRRREQERKSRRSSRFRSEGPTHRSGTLKPVTDTPTQSAAAAELLWDGPKTVAMFAFVIFLSAMIYTFISGV
jgi:serine/threonine-protein kinase